MWAEESSATDIIQRIATIETIPQFEQLLHDYMQSDEQDALLRVRLWRSYAELLELRGDIGAAREYFLRVHEETRVPQFLLRAAILAIELGDIEEAETELKKLLGTTHAGEARLHLIRISGFTHTLEEVWHEIYMLFKESPSPDNLYYAWEVARRLRYTELAKEAEDLLEHLFPQSAEYSLLQAKKSGGVSIVQDMPLPSRLFYSSPVSTELVHDSVSEDAYSSIPYGLQVGSFSKKENAERLLETLQAQGLTAEISEETIEERLFFRVLIQNHEELPMQEFVISLRAKSIEGVLLNDR